VALSGKTVVVGDPHKSIPARTCAGAAYAYLLDSIAPTTTATGLQTAVGGPWIRIFPQVSLSAADDAGGSGAAATYCQIDGAAQQTYTAPFTLADGAHTVAYRSVDKAGNLEATHTGYANVDSKAPTASANKMTLRAAKAKRGKRLTFHLTISDPQPSCGTASYTLTLATMKGKKLWTLNSSSQLTNKSLTVSYKLKKTLKKGSYSIVCSSTDAAGNVQAKVTKAKLKFK
jgi:hypothetical protein